MAKPLQLSSLSAVGNEFRVFPAIVTACTALMKLNLSENHLEQISPEVSKLESLTSLEAIFVVSGSIQYFEETFCVFPFHNHVLQGFVSTPLFS